MLAGRLPTCETFITKRFPLYQVQFHYSNSTVAVVKDPNSPYGCYVWAPTVGAANYALGFFNNDDTDIANLTCKALCKRKETKGNEHKTIEIF